MYLGFSTPPITSKNDFSKYIELWTWGLVLSPITSKIDFLHSLNIDRTH
jgi:hypothetical protein